MTRSRRILNLRFSLGLALALVLLGGSVHLVHAVQERRLAASLLTQADLAERRDDLVRAETYLGRYIVSRPEDTDAFARYALVHARAAAGRADQLPSLETLERAVARDPGRADVRRRAVDLAMLPALGRFRSADEHLEKLLLSRPNDGELEELRGRCHEALAREARDAQAELRIAEGWYARAIGHAPHAISAYERRAALLRGPLARTPGSEALADALMDARVEKDGVITHNPKSAAAHMLRARYRKQYGIAGADADVALALAQAPDDLDALLAAAEQARESGDAKAARLHLERGLSVATGAKDARFYQILASLDLKEGRPADAAAAVRRGLRAIPGEPVLLWDLADLLLRAGQLEEADRLIGDELKKSIPPIHPATILFLEGRLAIARGRWVEAVDRMERARALAGTSPGLTGLNKFIDLILADGYGRLGNPDRRLAASRRVLAIDPGSTFAQLGQAAALVALGRNDEALEQLRRAPVLDPAARLTAARLLISRLGRLPEGQRDWDEVDRILGEAGPESLDLAMVRAEAWAARGMSDRARATLEQARSRDRDEPGPWIGLANLAARDQKPDAGLAVLEDARKALGNRVELALARARLQVLRDGPGATKALEDLAAGVGSFEGEDRVRLLAGLADHFAQIGRRDRAVALWTRVAEERPDDMRAATLLFEAALEDGPADGPKLQQAIDRLARIEGPDGAFSRYAQAARIVLLARTGDRSRLDEARRLLAEARERRPGWSLVPRLEAEIHDLEGHPTQAAEAYLAAIDKGDRDPAVIRRATRTLYQQRRYTEADRLIQRLAEQAPAEGTVGKLAAESLLHRQDREGAVELARRAVPPDSKDYRDRIWLGQLQALAGHAPEAEDQLRRAVALAGDRPEVWVALIEHLVRTGKQKPSEEALAQAERRIKAGEAPSALAYCYELVGRVADAERMHRTALEARPGDPTALVELAAFYRRAGQVAKAEAGLRQILDASVKSDAQTTRWARRQLALVLAAADEPRGNEEGLRLLEQNIRDQADSIEDLQVRALLLARQIGNRRDAIQAYEDLSRLGPLTPADKLSLAELHEAGHNPSKAGEILQSALAAGETGADDPRLLAAYTRNLLVRGQLDQAETWLSRLEKVQADSPLAVELRARLLAARGDHAAVVALLRKFSDRKGGDIARVAILLEDLGQHDAAEALYREGAADPGKPERALLLAEFLARRGRVAESLEACDRARAACRPEDISHAAVALAYVARPGDDQLRRIEGWLDEAGRKEPGNAAIQFDLANLKIYRGDYPGAEATLRQIMERDKAHAAPLNNLAWMLALREGRGAEALNLANRAIALGGAGPDALDTRALAYLSLGQAEPAIKDLREAVAVRPTSDKLLHLARAYAQSARKPEAAEALDRARKAGLEERTLHPLELDGYRRLLSDLARN